MSGERAIAALRERLVALHVFHANGYRAPHKPLLVLLALGRYARGADRMMAYGEIREDLSDLLHSFGRPARSQNPHHPFWRLKADGVWDLDEREPEVRVTGSGDPWVTDLERLRVCGGFPVPFYEAVRGRVDVCSGIAQELLALHFPETLHDEILSRVRLGCAWAWTRRLPRDPTFRARVLAAYENRCAVCGFDVCLNGRPLALEAAHIRWHQAQGPDAEDNGLSLCSMHHELFDSGAFTLREGHMIVADGLFGTTGLEEWLLRFKGKAINRPRLREHYPHAGYAAWHAREVFRDGHRAWPAKGAGAATSGV